MERFVVEVAVVNTLRTVGWWNEMQDSITTAIGYATRYDSLATAQKIAEWITEHIPEFIAEARDEPEEQTPDDDLSIEQVNALFANGLIAKVLEFKNGIVRVETVDGEEGHMHWDEKANGWDENV